MTAPTRELPIAVVMGLSPTGLHVVRTLGRAGVKVIGLSDSFQAGGWSRYLARSVRVRTAEQKLAALLDLAAETPRSDQGRPVLIPTSDQDVDLIINNAEVIAQRFNFQKSYSDGVAAQILAKDTFSRLCSEHGIPHPQTWTCDRSELAGILEEAALPCMVKPSLIHDIKAMMKGKKGWIIENASQIASTLANIPMEIKTLVVQEIIPGPESSISVACTLRNDRGEQIQTFTARKLRQYPPGFGSASLVQSSPEPEAVALMERFLDATNYFGIAAAEFKRHPESGALSIIEVNVRPSLWFSLTEAAGRPVVLSTYRELSNGVPLRSGLDQANGVRWRYGIKDAWSSLFYRRNPTYFLGKPDLEIVGPAERHTSAVFSFDDPLPILAETANFLGKALLRWKAS